MTSGGIVSCVALGIVACGTTPAEQEPSRTERASSCIPIGDECEVSFDCCTALCNADGLCAVSDCTDANGSPCDDRSPCTVDDTCEVGACVGSPLANGVSCDDGRACTAGDVCTDGTCGGAEVPDGTTCDDRNTCTIDDECTAGVCAGTIDEGGACDDGNDCTVEDRCNAEGLCRDTVDAPDGTICDDGDVCTELGTCAGGVCNASPNPSACIPDGCACVVPVECCSNFCPAGSCQPAVPGADAAGVDASGTPVGDGDSGCGCRTAARADTPALPVLLAGVFLLLVNARRKRRRPA